MQDYYMSLQDDMMYDVPIPYPRPGTQLRQPEQVCGTRKNGASHLLNCTYILHRKLEKC